MARARKISLSEDDNRYSLRVSHDQPDVWLQQVLPDGGWPCNWRPDFVRVNNPLLKQFVLYELFKEHEPKAAALAILNIRRFRRTLYFPSLPIYRDGSQEVRSAFWAAVERDSRERKVGRVQVASFEACIADTPIFSARGRVRCEPRWEYFIDLSPTLDEIYLQFSSIQKNNIKTARKKEIKIVCSSQPNFMKSHIEALVGTADRRRRLRQSGPLVDEDYLLAVLKCGGHFFQLLSAGEEVLSSMLILETPKRAFYFSGGTTPVGMKFGVSHLAIWEAVKELKKRGKAVLSLGGVDANAPAGLVRFKKGFANLEVALGTYYVSL